MVEIAFRGNMSRRLKRANKMNARAAIIIGPDELARDGATLRDLDSGEQTDVSLSSLAGQLAPYR